MDIKERIREMADAVGVELAEESGVELVPPGRCWVETRATCSFGNPEGQYVLRPEMFCNENCHIYARSVHDPELSDEKRAGAVRQHFDEHKVTVISELTARAEELPEDSAERLALELAADVLDEKKLGRTILLEEDLPGE